MKLDGGRLKKFRPKRSPNDMWLACAKAFDIQMTSLGTSDMYRKPLEIMLG